MGPREVERHSEACLYSQLGLVEMFGTKPLACSLKSSYVSR